MSSSAFSTNSGPSQTPQAIPVNTAARLILRTAENRILRQKLREIEVENQRLREQLRVAEESLEDERRRGDERVDEVERDLEQLADAL